MGGRGLMCFESGAEVWGVNLAFLLFANRGLWIREFIPETWGLKCVEL